MTSLSCCSEQSIAITAVVLPDVRIKEPGGFATVPAIAAGSRCGYNIADQGLYHILIWE